MTTRLDNTRTVRAPRGTERSAKSWLTEAPLRMLMNNLDPEVAEQPGELVVYGGIGRAARDWQSFDRIVAALRDLEADETLLVQSGKPVGVFRTHADAPRVLIANSNLVPHWATWEHFNELDRKGLMMFGQMTAGSWIYIGSQGIVQGTYETFVEMARQHYRRQPGRPLDPDRGPGRHGRRAAAGRDHGRRLVPRRRMPAEQHRVPPAHRLSRQAGARPRRGAGDHPAGDGGEEGGVGRPCSATPPTCCPSCCAAACRPDCRDRPDVGARSDQRLPAQGLDLGRVGSQAHAARPTPSPRRPGNRWRGMCAPCSSSTSSACRRSTTATTSARWRWRRAWPTPSAIPGFVPAYIRPLFCRGIGPFRWAALSGDPEDIYRTDAKVKELMPDNAHLHNWLDMAQEAHQVPGTAGAHLLGRAGRPPSPGARLQRDGGQAAS